MLRETRDKSDRFNHFYELCTGMTYKLSGYTGI